MRPIDMAAPLASLIAPRYAEIRPLDRFPGVICRPRDVTVVELCHRDEIFQRTRLLGQFLAHPDDLIIRPHVVHLCAFFALDLEQPVDSIESNPPIIADDATAAICVGETGDNARLAALHDLGCVCIEHAVVMRFPVFGESLVDLRIRWESGRLQTRFDHAQAAVREDCALERLVGLQADDDFIVAVNVTGLVREQCRWIFRIDCKHAFLPLRLKIGLKLFPNRFGPF